LLLLFLIRLGLASLLLLQAPLLLLFLRLLLLLFPIRLGLASLLLLQAPLLLLFLRLLLLPFLIRLGLPLLLLLLVFLLLLVRCRVFLIRRFLLAESQGSDAYEQEQNEHDPGGCHGCSSSAPRPTSGASVASYPGLGRISNLKTVTAGSSRDRVSFRSPLH